MRLWFRASNEGSGRFHNHEVSYQWPHPQYPELNAHCAFYSSPHLYIVGGREGGVARAEVYRRHLGREEAWQSAASMPGPRAAAGCVHDPAQDR